MSKRPDLDFLFLGIDGGGTNCRARLSDAEGKVLGEGQAGSANCTPGLETAFSEVMIATHRALDDARLPHDSVQRIFAGLGLAGLSSADSTSLANRTFDHPFVVVVAELDAVAACLGAHMGQDGAILIIGTGTCGWLIKDGKSDRVGGWGFNMSDQGGGAHLGRTALRQALKEYDSILPTSAFGESLMEQFNHRPENLVVWSKTATPKDYGRFALAVFDYADQGDKTATFMIANAALDIDRMIAALVSKGADRVSLIGGMAEPIRSWLSTASTEALVETQGDPLDGALMLARQAFEMDGVNA